MGNAYSINHDLCHTFLSGDVPRVNGQLAVSRAFGDKSLKSHLRSDPDIQDTIIDAHTEVLILASDGLWKVIVLLSKLCFLAAFVVRSSHDLHIHTKMAYNFLYSARISVNRIRDCFPFCTL